jgi:hypothetical protein
MRGLRPILAAALRNRTAALTQAIAVTQAQDSESCHTIE